MATATTIITTSTGTIPHTIEDAIRVCTMMRHRRTLDTAGRIDTKDGNLILYSNEDQNQKDDNRPVDLLVVLTRIECKKHRFVRFGIQDISSSSHPDTVQVQILLFGKRRYHELIDVMNIKVGDIVRFNRMILLHNPNHSNNNNSLSVDRDTSNNSTTITIFSSDNDNPEIGTEYYRFGTIYTPDTLLLHRVSMTCSYFNEEEIPYTMRTNPQCIRDLIARYRSSVTSDLMIANTNPDIVTYIDANPTTVLEPLPCQHRTLQEFQSCIGLIGHTTVNVVQIEMTKLSIKNNNTKRRTDTYNNRAKKAKRDISTMTTSTPILIMFVTVMDESQTHTTLIVDSHSTDRYEQFRTILSQARINHQPVVLTNVTSSRMDPKVQQHHYCHRSTTLPVGTSSTEAVILVPTWNLDIVLIQHPIVVLPAKRQQEDDCYFSQIPLTLTTAPLQQHETRTIEITITSPIIGISPIKQDVSFDRHDTTWINPRKSNEFSSSTDKNCLSLLLQSALHSAGPHDTSIATLQLRVNHGDNGNNTNELIPVEANAAIIRCLCGCNNDDFDVDCMSILRSSRQPPSTSSNILTTKLKQCMVLSLQSLISDQIELRWVIEKIVHHDRNDSVYETTNQNLCTYRVLDVWLTEF
jgi:hypothetical protein